MTALFGRRLSRPGGQVTQEAGLLLALAGLAAVLTLAAAAAGLGELLPYLLPGLALLLPLLAGRYPGEGSLIRALERTRPRRARRQPPSPLRSRRAIVLPRGGALVGAAMAGRAPPLVVATA